MKRKVSMIIMLGLIIATFVGCGKNEEQNSSGKLKVYTSFYPMYDFACKVGGDKLAVTNLVPAGIEPHEWEPSPADIVNLENGDVFIYSGAGMEHWTEKVIKTLKNKNLVVLQASEAIPLSEGDPHVWLSIKYAKKQMENIKNALVKADEKNKQYYEDNYNKYAKEFDTLDNEFNESISPLQNKNIVVAHDAFAYLCRDYGLKQVAVEGLSPDSEPEPARMAEIINFVKENNVKVIFFEELASSKVSETIAKATGAKTDVLYTLEGLNDEQLAAGRDYISVMRENLAALIKALK